MNSVQHVNTVCRSGVYHPWPSVLRRGSRWPPLTSGDFWRQCCQKPHPSGPSRTKRSTSPGLPACKAVSEGIHSLRPHRNSGVVFFKIPVSKDGIVLTHCQEAKPLTEEWAFLNVPQSQVLYSLLAPLKMLLEKAGLVSQCHRGAASRGEGHRAPKMASSLLLIHFLPQTDSQSGWLRMVTISPAHTREQSSNNGTTPAGTMGLQLAC